MRLPRILMAAILSIAFGAASQAQVKTTVTLPDWGVAGFDNAKYYYIPDIETYYDIKSGQYVYMNDGKWVRTKNLPVVYKDYDLYDGYKVVIEDEAEPYPNFEAMRVKYAKGFKGEPQKTYKVKKTASGKLKIKEK